MISELEIREMLARCLSGDCSLDLFEDWIAGESWNIHQAGSPEAQKLVYAIELRLSEHSSGHLDRAEFLRELSNIASSAATSSFDPQTGTNAALNRDDGSTVVR